MSIVMPRASVVTVFALALALGTAALAGADLRRGAAKSPVPGDNRTDAAGDFSLADCNENGTEDADDIANLTSPDCNTNGLPDECEIDENSTADGGPFFCTGECNADCNDTGVPDECELADNDCNSDGRPDECAMVDDCLWDVVSFPAPLNSNATSDVGGDLNPQLTTDGLGNWVAVWSSNDDLGGTIGTDLDILFSRSTDSGANWTAPAPLNSNADSDTGDDRFPQLTTDGQGKWLAVWHSNFDPVGPIGTDIDIIVARSTNNGIDWTAPEPLNSNAASDYGRDSYPQLTTDGRGNWLAVWRSADDLDGTIGADWDILFAHSRDGGASWSAPAPINSNAASDTGDDISPQLTTDGQGHWLAVWRSDDSLDGTIGDDYDILYARNTDNGTGWTAPAPLNTNAASDYGWDYHAQLTTDGQGNWLAVWRSSDDLGGTIGRDGDIVFSRSTDNGRSWTDPLPLNSNAASDYGDDRAPQLTTDRQGNWLVVWHSDDRLGWTIGDDNDVLFSRSADNGANWADVAPFNTNAASDSRSDLYPQLTTDGLNNWVAVWSSYDGLGETIGGDADIVFSRFRSVGEDCDCNGIADACDISDCTDDPACGDCDGNGVPNQCEIVDCVGDPACDDCNGNDIPDMCELTDNDCNLNGRPDECENDCNCNGVDDAEDIASQTSNDCNGEGTPDECEITDCAQDIRCGDCNGNGILDQCDIAACAGDPACDDCNGSDIPDECELPDNDCNFNGRPDECDNDCNCNGVDDADDVANLTSPDCNTNGIPDECEIDESSTAPGEPFFCDALSPPEGLVDCDPDCNDTGVPDECELADNDCNSDGWPDECGMIDECLWGLVSFSAALNSNAANDTGVDARPQLTTDGQGNWVAVWQSRNDLGGTIGTDYDILFSRSTDDGATWTAPAPLNDNAASDNGNDYDPQLTTDGHGYWLAVWHSDDRLGGTIEADLDILFSRSTDNGANWTAAAPLNSNAASDIGSDSFPQLTTDGRGTWLAVWRSEDDLDGTIGTDYDILFSRSTDNGASWTAPAALNSNAASDIRVDDGSPQLTTDRQGHWLAVWVSDNDLGETIGTDDDVLFSRSIDGGASWTYPAPLNSNAASDTRHDYSPQLTTDRRGNWLAVWVSGNDLGETIGTDDDILFSRSMDGGASWTYPAPLNRNAAYDKGSDRHPQLATDRRGNWMAVWESKDTLGNTIGFDYDILSSRSKDNGASWTYPVPLNSNAASDRSYDYRPQLTTDARGSWLALWESQDDLDGTVGTDYDILFSRIRSIDEDCNCDGIADACAIADCTGDPACDDCNDNGVPDQCDIANCTGGPACDDCNGNGVPDECELTDNDCNFNGRPDECDNDCNCNGVDDFDDITGQTSNDCNSDGTPDECQIADCAGGPWCRDCNGNGVLDPCDIADCTGDPACDDCNDNGVPDECELTDNDCNFNSRPDECENDCNCNGLDDADDITGQTSNDCNSNGTPDECEIDQDSYASGGPFLCNPDAPPNALVQCDPDCNYTGIPDECELADNDCNFDGRPDECGVIDDCMWDVVSFPSAINSNAASDIGNDHYPQLTTDGQGNWLTVWESLDDLGGTIGTDSDILFSRSTNNGATWTVPAPLNSNAASDTGADLEPQLATDGKGNWLAVWFSRDDLGETIGDDLDILFSRSADDGATWSFPAPLNSNAASEAWHDEYPQITTDGKGNWIAVWESLDDLGGTIGYDSDILFSRSTNNGATWTDLVPLNSNAASDTGRDYYPQLTTDGHGNWLAVWQSLDDVGGTIVTDSNILSSRSKDNGATWNYPAPFNSNAASEHGHDYVPQLTTDGRGRWLVVWASNDDLGGTIGADRDILFTRFRSVGEDCNCNGAPDECDGGTGDTNGDGVVSVMDYFVFADCLTGPCVTVLFADTCCALDDMDEDEDIDLADFARFQTAFTAP